MTSEINGVTYYFCGASKINGGEYSSNKEPKLASNVFWVEKNFPTSKALLVDLKIVFPMNHQLSRSM